MLSSPRLLFYAVNGLGLGHVTRLAAIARHVRVRRPSSQILFITSSDADTVLVREDFAVVKTPSRSARKRQSLPTSRFAQLAQSVTWSAISAFQPHLLIVDTFPAGALQELLPVLSWEMSKVFVFREQRIERAEHPLTQNSLALYDRILVPHLEGEAQIPTPEGSDVCWVGPIFIRDRSEALSREEARSRLGLPVNGTIVYVSFGGGGDPESARCFEIAARALEEAGILGAYAPGPLSWHRPATERIAGLRRIEYYPMAECLSAFDAAVSAAGYNSVMEMLHHGLPALFIPFERQVDDQKARCRRFAEAGAALTLDDPTPCRIRKAVLDLLNPSVAAHLREASMAMIPENGAGEAARWLLDLVDSGRKR